MATFTEEQEKYIKIVGDDGHNGPVGSVTIVEPNLAGEHTASSCVTVDIKFESGKEINLFVKTFTTNPGYADLVKEMNLFSKEQSFFNLFVKDAEHLCEEKVGSPKAIQIFPKLWYGTDEIIVLDNLMSSGYVMLKKEDCQDFNQAKMVLEKLARLHAVSSIMLKNNGVDKFKEKYAKVVIEAFEGESFENMMSPMYDNSLRTIIKILQNNDMPGRDAALEYFKSYVGKAFRQVMDTLEYDTGDKLLVLNHGDAWNNNMMFHKCTESGALDDVMLIDLQVARIATPSVDLSYFLFTSVKPGVRREHFNTLMKIYYDKFCQVVTSLGEEAPFSFEELLHDYGRKSVYGYFMALTSNCAPGAMAEMDFEKMDPEVSKLIEQMSAIVESWVKRNPDEARKIAEETIFCHEEFLGYRKIVTA